MTFSSRRGPVQQDPDSRPTPGPLESAVESVADALDIKPRLRGWLHAGAAPFALAAGIVLVVLAPTTGTRIASAVYALTGILLFGVSAVYHRGNWSPPVKRILKRLDHTNIMLVIAGSYTPLAWSLLPRDTAVVLLWIIWSGAVAGVGFRLLWLNAPRWLYTPVYIALGLAAVFYIPDFWSVNAAVAILVITGGAAYIAGAIIYALKRPNPSVTWFGFHEIFHAFTLVGFACHYAAILIAVLSVQG
ncbi:hemolysin III family protein [Arthrobacter sp. Sa2BUA2]|uniref:Hemolysin III family protein n=1 Tax=Arthrobacter pullicola TaxID=2762224 RepID=A0ABR8YFZ6_9MICC|nr:hemolysin III family protein [Arthrobacter pullicola]